MNEQVTQYSDFNTVSKFQIRWMKAKFLLFIFSVFLMTFSFFQMSTKGLNLGIDFRGGVLLEVGLKDNIPVQDLRRLLQEQNIESVNVQSFGTKEVLINIGQNHQISPEKMVENVKFLLIQKYADKVSFRRTEIVGPKVGEELISTSVMAVTLSVLAMLVYIWFRFELPFAIGSVVALVHDVVITLGIFALFQFEFGLPIIAALLTIVGYSMNDTVVIYDRIRESLIKYRRASIADIIDLSVNETLARTLVTGGTTLLSLGALLIFGGEVIKPFVWAMAIGVIVGTYSSVFVAAPVLLLFQVKNKFKEIVTLKK